MTTLLTRRYRLSALHDLNPLEEEPLVHGHEYQIYITLKGEISLSNGLLIKREKMDKIVNEILIQPFHGKNLKRFFEFPSGEVLCYEFFQKMKRSPLGQQLHRLSIQETKKNFFSYPEMI